MCLNKCYNRIVTLKNIIPNSQCLLCGLPSSEAVCQYCEYDSPFFAKTFSTHNLLHQPSITRRLLSPNYDALYALGHYSWPFDTLVKRSKFHQSLVSAQVLTEWFLNAIKYRDAPYPTLIIPVPTTLWSQYTRRYNLIELVAVDVGKALNIPVFHNALKRTWRGSKKQRSLKRQARLKNLINAFKLTATLNTSHIAIMDDVVTTGATANTLAKLLKSHYPNLKIEIWALAITP